MTAGRVNPWLVLVLVCLAQFMVVLDATIVNVALPSIQADLGISESSLPGSSTPTRCSSAGSCCSAGAWRPAGTQARLPRGPRALHVRLAPLRARERRDVAHPRARAAGARRGAGLARGALDRDDDLQGGRRADEGARRVGRDRGRRRRRRPRARRAPRRRTLLAVDLLRQRAGRDRGVHPLAPPRPRVEGRACAPELRSRRGRDGHRRPGRARLRDRPLGRSGLGLCRGARLPRTRGRCSSSRSC